jgi:hypothetical protein
MQQCLEWCNTVLVSVAVLQACSAIAAAAALLQPVHNWLACLRSPCALFAAHLLAVADVDEQFPAVLVSGLHNKPKQDSGTH